jgi:hypothetical protein
VADDDKAKKYAQDMKGVEIFSAGVWNGDPYTEADLDGIVSAYGEMPRQPPLKLGHSEAQKFFGQADGHPALGWVEKIYRSGKKLLADFVNVPDTLIGMIRDKRYDKVSAEIYWNYKLADGKVLPRALKAVSILGADWPAVSNLQDLQAALLGEADRIVKVYDGDDAEVHSYDHISDAGGLAMEKKEYEDKIASLTSDLAKAQEDGKATTARADAAEKASLEAELKVFSLELDGLVRQGKILPAEVEGYKSDFRAMGTTIRKYTEGGKEIEKAWGEKKLDELKARPKLVEFKEQAQGGDDDEKKKAPAGESVSQLTEKIMNERKCTYSEAQEAVRSERPDLFAAYVTRKEDKK